jgi:adenylate kinase family enzyme
MSMLNKKIAIVGCGGAGKTTLALQLQEKLNLPVYHLDQFHWKSDWQRVDPEMFYLAHHELCEQATWIIEGSYIKLFYYRANQADIIIFLDIPRYRCIWNVIKRSGVNLGKVLLGSAEGCQQRLFSFEFLKFLKWIWDFNRRNRKTILSILNDVKEEKQVYIIKSFKEIDELISRL